MFKIKALEIVEAPSVYCKEGKKKRAPKAALFSEILLSYLLVFFLCAGSVLVYDSVFPLESPVRALFLCIGIVEILLFFVYRLPVLRRFAPLLTACGFFVGFLFLREPIVSGMKQCANEVIRKFNAHFGAEIFVFQEVEETALKQTAVYFMTLLFLWWFVEALLHLRKIPLLAVPPLFLICGELLIGKAPDELPLVMVAGVFFILLSFGNGGNIEAGGEAAALRGKAAVFLAAAFFLSLFLVDRYGRETAESLVKLQDEVLSYQFALEKQIEEYAPGGFWGQNPGRVSNKAPKYEGKEVISITTNKAPAGNVYLRGYAGDTYRNGNWTNRSQLEFEDTMSAQLSYANKVLAGGYVLNLLYQSQVAELTSYRSKYQLQYSDCSEDYAYLPYMTDLEHVSKDGRTMTPLLLEADTTVYRNGADMLYAEGISPYDFYRDVKKGVDYTGNKVIENCYNGYLSQYLRVPSGLLQLKELGGQLRQKLEQNFRRLSNMEKGKAESLVTAREIYAAYLVREEIFKRTSYSLELDRLPFGEDVVEYFLFDSGKGFCEHYASAGVLLLRLMGIPARYISGYVVRPQEFVRISDAEGSGKTEYSALVKDSAAHAWVEIFVEHVGWVPVEMTEGSVYTTSGEENYNAEFYDALWQGGGSAGNTDGGYEHEGDVNRVQKEETPLQKPEETEPAETEARASGETEAIPESTAQQAQEDNASDTVPGIVEGNKAERAENGGGSEETKQQETEAASEKGNGILACSLIAGICAFGLFVLLSCRRRHRRKTVFKQENARKEIERMVSGINHKLWRRGILKTHNLDDRGYREALRRGLAMIPEGELQEYFLVLERMAYSNEALGEKEVRCCYRIYKWLRNV